MFHEQTFRKDYLEKRAIKVLQTTRKSINTDPKRGMFLPDRHSALLASKLNKSWALWGKYTVEGKLWDTAQPGSS
jgi:hypothetical protein